MIDDKRLAQADSATQHATEPGPARRARLQGRSVPVWSYLHRKLNKRFNNLRTRWRLATRPEAIRLRGVRIMIERPMYSEKIIRRLYDGRYERQECQALERTLRCGDSVLELGTGIGYLSAVAARRIGDRRVTTCEANGALLPAIRRIHELNGVRPTVMHGVMTVESHITQRAFYTHSKNFWSSSLREPNGQYELVSVPALPWHAELARLQPSYLIMDIEGGEIELLDGFDHPSVQRLLIEFHPRKTGDTAVDRIVQHLARVGFARARVDPDAHVFYFER